MRFEAEQRLKKGREKLNKILSDKSPTLMLGGSIATDIRLASAAYNAGARIFEPNHPAVALQQGLEGVKTMGEAEEVRYQIPHSEMIKKVKALKAGLPSDIFITMAFRGAFTEKIPIPFTFEDAIDFASAGADCIHTHKSSIEDVEEITKIAHKAGLLVEAYITYDDQFGVNARDNDSLRKAVKNFEEIGVDLIGLATGKTYQGKSSSGFSQEFIERVNVFCENTSAFTVLEGGIRAGNIETIKTKTSVDIIVISTAIDQVLAAETTELVTELLDK